MTNHTVNSPQFFLTAPSPCPYLEGESERKVFTHLVGDKAPALNDLLTQGGFRRSQNIAYRPACETCRACISVRILASEFNSTRSMRKNMATNADLVATEYHAEPSNEQFKLFRRYLDSRHKRGGMADMSISDYAMMVEDSHVDTRIIEYRVKVEGDGLQEFPAGPLVGAALTDRMSDGLSMVYSFYDPNATARSLGTYMILDHIERAKALGLPHVYLGYWVEGSRKMEYKTRFLPQEHLMAQGWRRYQG
ncbi:arginyltransferase [Hoeflea sp. G2-23]|uniref:Aspartate/glutamate leucyltransferase n=1 Tax=Hoeflea algicola TaxID=2983763 RepID=A0ABT3Z423_9HYPH|nr:arginyltransferase [Hoeflea algicola]MCY0146459.1 arginyltransferase [Hoeflea algicola]